MNVVLHIELRKNDLALIESSYACILVPKYLPLLCASLCFMELTHHTLYKHSVYRISNGECFKVESILSLFQMILDTRTGISVVDISINKRFLFV